MRSLRAKTDQPIGEATGESKGVAVGFWPWAAFTVCSGLISRSRQ